jgi:hypothetical protein
MLLHDLRLGPWLHDTLPYADITLHVLGVGVVLAIDIALRVRDHRRNQRAARAARDERDERDEHMADAV